ncbi:MAG: SLC13 family permease [Kiritimatiellae bacterium]|nr:SLC13 family permease [Kiritimatiellia bacterium]
MDLSWWPPAVFAAAYVLFVLLPRRRALCAVGAAAVLMLVGAVPWRIALTEHVSWNVVLLFFGTLILAELFMQSRMPAVIAEAVLRRTRTGTGAMLAICGLASAMSVVLENVAVVLLVAPVALTLCRRLGVSPVRLLVLIALCSNLQGTATLIGDPPSMILAGHMHLSFNQFFFYRGRPSVFWIVQSGAVASMVVSGWLLRRHREPVEPITIEPPRAWTPTVLLAVFVVGLTTTHRFDPDFQWLAGAWASALAAVGLLWYRTAARWGRLRDLIRSLDWDTTFFLMGVFVLVGSLSSSGWLDRLARMLAGWSGRSVGGAFALVLALSVAVSGFVDNVPYLAAMIPVVSTLSTQIGAREPALLLFALLIGSCLGGNLTPIGASANVVAVGLLRREGHLVRFGEFLRIGAPFTLAAVGAGAAVLWWLWR